MAANIGAMSGVRGGRGGKGGSVILRSCAMKKLCLGGCIIDIIPV